MEDIKTLSLDLETYSDVDLGKCGVYRYAESPNFEILLFGYAINGGEVNVVDLALGEKIPEEILNALTDNSITNGHLTLYSSASVYHIGSRNTIQISSVAGTPRILLEITLIRHLALHHGLVCLYGVTALT